MSYFVPTGAPSVINGWTAFSAQTPTNPTTTTSNVSAEQSAASGNQSLDTAPPAPQVSAADQALFDKPYFLFDDTMLDVATRYSNTQISDYINNGASSDKLTSSGVHTRIKAAITRRAKATNQTVDEVKTEFDKARASNVTSRTCSHRAHAKKTPSHSLCGETLLTFAESHTNEQIGIQIAAVSGKAAPGKRAIHQRIQIALEARSRATGVSIEQVRASFATIRKGNGIHVKMATNVDEAEPAPQAVVAAQTNTPAQGETQVIPTINMATVAEIASEMIRFRDMNGERC